MDKKIIQPDGSLHNVEGPFYISWRPNEKRITLDGEFTTEDLLWFISHMKNVKVEGLNYAK